MHLAVRLMTTPGELQRWALPMIKLSFLIGVCAWTPTPEY